jgi:hypothetical protein
MSRTSYTLNKVLTALARQHLVKDGLTDEDLAGHDVGPGSGPPSRPGTSRPSTISAPTRT